MPRGGWAGGRNEARVGVGGVSNSIRAFPIGWVDVCILTPARQRGAGLNGGLMRVACVLCGACSGHLSVVSRAALRPTRILLFRYYGIDTRAAARCPGAADGGGGLHLGLLDILVFMHSRHARPPQ